MSAILLVDDKPDILEILENFVQEAGRDIVRASSGQEALELLRNQPFDLVISDISMPDLSGVELLKQARNLVPDTLFVMITGYASTDTAIDARQHGAYDFLIKPLKMAEVQKIVSQALNAKRLERQEANQQSDSGAEQSQHLFQALNRNHIIGNSPKMLEVYRTIGTIAKGDSTVLITGESGTGKELVARALHEASPRKDGRFEAINCGGIPETLLESELFGYMKGAFTSATSNKKGLFEVASGGSIFLDEIGELTLTMQVKLLRVLQERKIRPLGGTVEIPVDVRVIAATNRDLRAAIGEGRFRDDLYYRIAVLMIPLPPLRERTEDIELLAFHFLRQYASKSGRRITGISPEAMHSLKAYHWPGNIRELENTLERAVTLEVTDVILPDRLPDTVRHPQTVLSLDPTALPEGPYDLEAFLTNLERHLIAKVLERTGGNQALAAEYLKLTKPSLRHKIQTLGIDPLNFKHSRSAP